MANDKDFKVKNGIQPTVYHEGVGTVVSGSVAVGYDLSGAVYDSIDSAALSTQIGQGQGFFFKPDGTKMYASDTSNAYEYSLSTAWDLSTLSYSNNSLSLSSADDPNNTFFKTDGTKFYVVSKNDSYILEFDVSSAWDISTGSSGYSRRYLVSSQMSNPTGIFFKPDGSKMYVLSNSSDTVYQYGLSTAWTVTTASYESKSFSVTTQATNPRSIQLNNDGTKLFVSCTTTDYIYQYNLSTAYDISTASYSGYSLDISSQNGFPYSIGFKSDGLKIYMFGATSDKIHQYSSTVLNTNTLDLSTGSVFEITPTSDIQVGLSNPAASGTVSQATLLLDGGTTSAYDLANATYDDVSFDVSSQSTQPGDVVFSSDGTKMYIINQAGASSSVEQYNLSTAYDISTASHSSADSLTVGTQDTSPFGITFKPDGTKLYVTGTTGDNVYQYTLSTAYDLSTASYDSVSFSYNSQDTATSGTLFNSDGTKLYMLGAGTDAIYQYSLSTAYDVSTASYDSVSLSVSSQFTAPYGFRMNSDGTKFFVAGNGDIAVYTLSTAYDLSTASYTSTFDVNEDTLPYGVDFNSDGTKMFVVGITGDNVYQYSTGVAATITYPSTLEFAGGTAPTSPAIGETDVITFSTTDGGTSYQAVQAIDGAK